MAEKKIPWSEAAKAVLGGSTLVILALLFSTRYLGLGLPTIQAALEGKEVPLPAFLLKMLFTTVTLGFSGSGGIVTPIFFIGATAGTAFASAFGLSPYVFRRSAWSASLQAQPRPRSPPASWR